MVDFLRLNPYVTREEYMWKWTVPQIKLASYDFSHIEYGKAKNYNEEEFDDPAKFMERMGMKMCNNIKR